VSRVSEQRRRYQELDLGPHASGWVIHWEPGLGTGWHDHGGSKATIVVTSGVLKQRIRDGAGSQRTVVSGPGEVVLIEPHEQHEVCPNVPATATHVYTPRLETMNLFDREGNFIEAQDAAEELRQLD